MIDRQIKNIVCYVLYTDYLEVFIEGVQKEELGVYGGLLIEIRFKLQQLSIIGIKGFWILNWY